MVQRSPWLPYYRPDPGARLRLFCLPYAGGGASVFNGWSRHLPAGIDVCAVQLPGRESRLAERPHERIEPLVEAAAEGLRPWIDLPFVIFGHSMGGRLGFELARCFRRDPGLHALHLVVSGARAPQLLRDEPLIHALPEAEFARELGRLNGIPQAVLANAELRELFLPILRADFAVVETYRYRAEEPLACSISAFGGLEDPKASREHLVGWAEQTTGAFNVHMLPGDHFFLQSQRTRLLEMLSGILGGGLPPSAPTDERG